MNLPDQVGEDLSNSKNITNNLQICYAVNVHVETDQVDRHIFHRIKGILV